MAWLALALQLVAPALPLAGDMVWIPEGRLLMGSEASEPAEAPAHEVTVSGFWIDRHEVRNAQFREFVTATGHVTDAESSGWGWHWPGRWQRVPGAGWRHPRGPGSSIRGLDDHPVVQVSWNDANAYCRWRNKRLPSEAEWERAARGSGTRRYAWGSEPPEDEAGFRASYGAERCCSADVADGYLYTAPVGSFALGHTPSGVADLTGNVWEWTLDGFDPDYYRKAPYSDPVNLSATAEKVIRGGGWGNNPRGLRATLRHANRPDVGLSMVGMRCAR